jgi:transformation/transcription domain-associated protein
MAFQTWLLAINNRYPQKIFFSRTKGNVWNTEMLPALTPKQPTIHNKDVVPFRYTPNIQTFIGEVGLEGLFSCAIMAIARSLSEPEVQPLPLLNHSSGASKIDVLPV